ncbi:MAG: hypothetical protein J0L92_01120 [Deltaproteobacteria bacterium]|nr:hypothetical protein [Deltaproteobacteria bacterium]
MLTNEELDRLATTFVQRAQDYLAGLDDVGPTIRTLSEDAYGQPLQIARIGALSGLVHLISAPPPIKVQRSASIGQRLLLIGGFAQGVAVTERLISEGQYLKATAALKQDYEFVAALGTTVRGTSKRGKPPHAKGVPSGASWIYGKLNEIAHPSKMEVLAAVLETWDAGGVRGLSPVPEFKRDTAVALYEVHVFLLLAVLVATINLFRETHPDDHELLAEARLAKSFAEKHAKLAGFVTPPPVQDSPRRAPRPARE